MCARVASAARLHFGNCDRAQPGRSGDASHSSSSGVDSRLCCALRCGYLGEAATLTVSDAPSSRSGRGWDPSPPPFPYFCPYPCPYCTLTPSPCGLTTRKRRIGFGTVRSGQSRVCVLGRTASVRLQSLHSTSPTIMPRRYGSECDRANETQRTRNMGLPLRKHNAPSKGP